jgi:hypothetical protein
MKRVVDARSQEVERCRKRRFVRLGAQEEGKIGPLVAANATGLADVLGSHWAGLGLARLSSVIRHLPYADQKSNMALLSTEKEVVNPSLFLIRFFVLPFLPGLWVLHTHTRLDLLLRVLLFPPKKMCLLAENATSGHLHIQPPNDMPALNFPCTSTGWPCLLLMFRSAVPFHF